MPTPDTRVQDQIIPTLLQREIIDEEQLTRARNASQADGANGVLYHLVKLRLLPAEQATELLAEHFEVPAADLSNGAFDESIAHMLDAEMALKYHVLPIANDARGLRLAMANPRDMEAISAVRYQTNVPRVVPLVADGYSLAQRIDKSYNPSEERIQRALDELGFFSAEDFEIVHSIEDPNDQIEEEVNSAPIVKLVQGLLHDAVKRRASDIHIEPGKDDIVIRFRVDGALHEVSPRLPKRFRAAIAARIKIMAELKPEEQRRPQDGKAYLKIHGTDRVIDLRVSTIPVVHGEKVVIRILDKNAVNHDLDTLGMEPLALASVKRTLDRPVGMIIATGPTGSGKTTTLYSMLMRLNRPDVNIQTIENPVEYELPGVNQTQVHTEIGLDFATALKHFLRQDPNIMMVGEIRDQDTADTAVRAAITGHLVLSTLHTNDAPTAFTRLNDLGINPFLIASSVTTVIAQRLVRRVCPYCAKPAEYAAEWLDHVGIKPEELAGAKLVKGEGCPECDGSGYYGRLGLYEVLTVTKKIRDMIMTPDTPISDIREAARSEGMRTLREIGLEKARVGLTTLEEVIHQTIDV